MPLKVPYVDLVAQHAPIKDELLAAIARVIDHGQFVLGEETAHFEREFAELCGTRYAVGVNSGTDALILALKAVGVGSGDEVITVPNSFVASVSCIRLLGAKPVFVDVDGHYNMDPELIEAAITPNCKAIIPVHLTGLPCDMGPIMALADKYGLAVVEDCAQAVSAAYKGQAVGSFGAVGCFSLHPLKTLNACGDGGVLTTDNTELYEELLILRNLGLKTRDDCVVWSHNSRLDTLQSAMLMVKMPYLKEWTEKRRENAEYYGSRLADLEQVTLPKETVGAYPVYHTFVIQAKRRDQLRAFLDALQIGTAIHYPIPIHLTTAGGDLGYGVGSFPVAEKQAECILSLPIHQGLTADQLAAVCNGVDQFYESH